MEARLDARPSSLFVMTNLARSQESRASRGEQLADQRVEYVLDRVGLSEERCLRLAAEDVGPHARKKLKGILDKYRKSAHPFSECKRDQMSNGLSEDLANKRCATLKDIIRGTKSWRKGPKRMNASESHLEPCAVIDADVAVLLDGVDAKALADLLAEETTR